MKEVRPVREEREERGERSVTPGRRGLGSSLRKWGIQGRIRGIREFMRGLTELCGNSTFGNQTVLKTSIERNRD